VPYNRPGSVLVDVIATKQVNHGTITFEDGVPGVAVKTLADPATAGLVNPKVIAIGEAFNMIIKGIVQIANAGTGAPYARGAALYLTKATNAITNVGPASATVARLGTVTEVAGTRGTPTGFMRVNLDTKDTLL
jgi:hypothetical protein